MQISTTEGFKPEGFKREGFQGSCFNVSKKYFIIESFIVHSRVIVVPCYVFVLLQSIVLCESYDDMII